MSSSETCGELIKIILRVDQGTIHLLFTYFSSVVQFPNRCVIRMSSLFADNLFVTKCCLIASSISLTSFCDKLPWKINALAASVKTIRNYNYKELLITNVFFFLSFFNVAHGRVHAKSSLKIHTKSTFCMNRRYELQ